MDRREVHDTCYFDVVVALADLVGLIINFAIYQEMSPTLVVIHQFRTKHAEGTSITNTQYSVRFTRTRNATLSERIQRVLSIAVAETK